VIYRRTPVRALMDVAQNRASGFAGTTGKSKMLMRVARPAERAAKPVSKPFEKTASRRWFCG